MFEFLWEVGKTLPLKGTQAELDTECLETFKRNTFNILISLPSRDCDLAKFFLLMHFTATSQSRFFKGLKKGRIYSKYTRQWWRHNIGFVSDCKNYLFMSAFEHNREGTVTNQVLPAELKLANRLHGSQKYKRVTVSEQVQEETRTVRRPCRRLIPLHWWKPLSSHVTSFISDEKYRWQHYEVSDKTKLKKKKKL